MAYNRIAVGFDGSVASRRALDWAVRQAVHRNALVLVVTAWSVTNHDPQALLAERIRLGEEQAAAIRAARAALAPETRPVVARELMIADPVLALDHVARRADLVVLGDDERPSPTSGSIAERLAQRLRRRGRRSDDPVPSIVVVSAPVTGPAATPARQPRSPSPVPAGSRPYRMPRSRRA